jgi:hypothetical protein
MLVIPLIIPPSANILHNLPLCPPSLVKDIPKQACIDKIDPSLLPSHFRVRTVHTMNKNISPPSITLSMETTLNPLYLYPRGSEPGESLPPEGQLSMY